MQHKELWLYVIFPFDIWPFCPPVLELMHGVQVRGVFGTNVELSRKQASANKLEAYEKDDSIK